MTTTSEPGTVSLEAHHAHPRLAVLRLHRPPLNALDQGMWDGLLAAGRALHGDSPYRAVVITGGEENFAGGVDLEELAALTPEDFAIRNHFLRIAFRLIATAPQVTVAAINGYAIGSGFELALAADFRLAGPTAVLGLPEVTLGLVPDPAGPHRLARVAGLTRAEDRLLPGRPLKPGEALRMHLIDEIAGDPVTAALERALPYAHEPLVLQRTGGPELLIGEAPAWFDGAVP